MPIKIEREPEELGSAPAEHCHFCGFETRYWHTATNTPVCKGCSVKYAVRDIERPVGEISTPADPVQAIRLMAHKRGLRTGDLVSVFGSRGTANDVLNYTSPLTLTHIRVLVAKFGMNPSELIASYALKPRKPPRERKRRLVPPALRDPIVEPTA